MQSQTILLFFCFISLQKGRLQKKFISHNMYQTFVWRGYAKFLWLHLILTWHTFISRKGNKAICSPTHMLILSWLDTRTNDIPLLSTNNAQWLGLVDKGYSNLFFKWKLSSVLWKQISCYEINRSHMQPYTCLFYHALKRELMTLKHQQAQLFKGYQFIIKINLCASQSTMV